MISRKRVISLVLSSVMISNNLFGMNYSAAASEELVKDGLVKEEKNPDAIADLLYSDINEYSAEPDSLYEELEEEMDEIGDTEEDEITEDEIAEDESDGYTLADLLETSDYDFEEEIMDF